MNVRELSDFHFTFFGQYSDARVGQNSHLDVEYHIQKLIVMDGYHSILVSIILTERRRQKLQKRK